MSFFTALSLCVFPFIIPDVAKVLLSVIVSDVLKKRHFFMQL